MEDAKKHILAEKEAQVMRSFEEAAEQKKREMEEAIGIAPGKSDKPLAGKKGRGIFGF